MITLILTLTLIILILINFICNYIEFINNIKKLKLKVQYLKDNNFEFIEDYWIYKNIKISDYSLQFLSIEEIKKIVNKYC